MTEGTERKIVADALRREFDAAFAAAPVEPVLHVEMLALRAGTQRYLLRLSEISGLHTSADVTPVPSRLPELLGIASVRAALVPVFDVHALLGLARSESPRWLVVLGAPVMALAFTDLDAQLRVPETCVVASHAPGGHGFVGALATTETGVVPVLDLPAVHAEVTRRARAASREPQEPR